MPTTFGAPFVNVSAPPLSPWQVERCGWLAQMTLPPIRSGPNAGRLLQVVVVHRPQVHFHQHGARRMTFDRLGLAPARSRDFRAGGDLAFK